MGTKENAIRLALLQIAVIVFAVLASAACLRVVEDTFTVREPTVTVFMTQHGWLLLMLPLGWTWLMVRRAREGAADTSRPATFLAGILLLIGFCLLTIVAVLQPWIALNTLSSVLGPPGG